MSHDESDGQAHLIVAEHAVRVIGLDPGEAADITLLCSHPAGDNLRLEWRWLVSLESDGVSDQAARRRAAMATQPANLSCDLLPAVEVVVRRAAATVFAEPLEIVRRERGEEAAAVAEAAFYDRIMAAIHAQRGH